MPQIDSRGVAISYEDTGGGGPPIMLVHGFSSSFDGNWRRPGWLDALVAAGRRVIALDCRGHGSSGKPHDPEAYSDGKMADDVVAVLDACGVDKADLMGYSMGGGISLDLVVRYPLRFKTVVLGGAGLRAPAAETERRRGVATRAAAANPAGFDDAAVARYNQRGADLKALAAVRRGRGMRRDEEAIRRLELPMLLVVGEKDGALAGARRLAGSVSHAELVVVPDADHLSAVGAPRYKEAVLEFLAKYSPVS